MKKTISTLLILGCTTSVFAQDMKSKGDFFIGIEHSKPEFDISLSTAGFKLESDEDIARTGLKVGMNLTKNIDTYIKYNLFDETDNNSISDIRAGIQYNPTYKNGFGYVLGFEAGRYSYEENANLTANGFDKDKVDISGLVLGAKAGVTYAIPTYKNLNFELGVQTAKYNGDDTLTHNTGTKVSAQIDSSSSVYFSVGYYF